MQTKIAIGNDHAGTLLKVQLKSFLEGYGFEVINFGTDTYESVDYPDYVHPVLSFPVSIHMQSGFSAQNQNFQE